MRIGMLVDMYKPYISGVTNYVSTYKRHFDSLGHQVFVFTFGEEDVEDDEPNVVRSPSLPISIGQTESEKGFHFGVRYNKAARDKLRSMDIAHVHHPFLSGPLALRYCKPVGIPVIFTNHTRYDLYFKEMLPQLPEGVGRAFLETYLPPFCRACDLVIAPSPGVRKVMAELGVTSNVEVVPNGVDLRPYADLSTDLTRADLGLQEDNVVLMYIGRLAPAKNLPFLLRAFAGAAQAYGNICLVLVGDGPERDNLEDRVGHMGLNNRVHFTGMVPYEMTPAYLSLADMFVTASVSEVHPLSVIEAMAAGLPALGIQSPGVGDIIEHEITGLVAPDDLAAFTASMVRLVVDADLRRELGERAVAASTRYSISKTGELILAHYNGLVQSAARRKRGLQSILSRLFRRRAR